MFMTDRTIRSRVGAGTNRQARGNSHLSPGDILVPTIAGLLAPRRRPCRYDIGAAAWSVRMSSPSLVIRNGTIVDGSGGDPYEADLAMVDGKIAAIGGGIAQGAEEIDARGKLVTPGFVELPTHYDAPGTLSEPLVPLS